MKYGDRNQPEAAHDPMWRLCCDFDEQGNRCGRPSTMTESTRGSDRWYCYRHFAPFRGLEHGREDPPAREYVSGKDLFTAHHDKKNWAREILALARIGKYTVPQGIECARDALGLTGNEDVIA